MLRSLTFRCKTVKGNVNKPRTATEFSRLCYSRVGRIRGAAEVSVCLRGHAIKNVLRKGRDVNEQVRDNPIRFKAP
eukprot:6188359-Pleurochrysis_carterae.AAC.3